MMEVLNESTDNVSDSFISNSEMPRREVLKENKIFKDQLQRDLDIIGTNVERFVDDSKNELRSMKMNVENKFCYMVHKIEKMLNESKLESLELDRRIEKMYLGSRQEDIKRAELEAAKYEEKMYDIVTLVCAFAAGVGVLYIFMSFPRKQRGGDQVKVNSS